MLVVRTLSGDVNRDGLVTTSDVALIKPHFQETVDANTFLFDFNADGAISTADASLIKPAFQNAAPSCP
jgi:hypothetical protein